MTDIKMAVTNKISQEVQNKYLKYVDDMDDLMYSNPNFRFYIGFDNQQLMFRMYVRNAVNLDRIVRHFREIDQSSFFTGRREPVYLYAVSPFGYFPTGLLFEVLNFVVNDFELNPMHMQSSQLVMIGPNAKMYVYDHLVPLAKRMPKGEDNAAISGGGSESHNPEGQWEMSDSESDGFREVLHHSQSDIHIAEAVLRWRAVQNPHIRP